ARAGTRFRDAPGAVRQVQTRTPDEALRATTPVRTRPDEVLARGRPFAAARPASGGGRVPGSDRDGIPFGDRADPPRPAARSRDGRDAQARSRRGPAPVD